MIINVFSLYNMASAKMQNLPATEITCPRSHTILPRILVICAKQNYRGHPYFFETALVPTCPALCKWLRRLSPTQNNELSSVGVTDLSDVSQMTGNPTHPSTDLGYLSKVCASIWVTLTFVDSVPGDEHLRVWKRPRGDFTSRPALTDSNVCV